MDKITLITALVIGIFSSSNAQTADNMTDQTFTSEQKQVMQTIHKMVSAFESKDLDAILSTYENQATVVFKPGKPILGTSSLKKAFTEAFQMNPQYTFGQHEVFITGNIAVHLTPWNMIGNCPMVLILNKMVYQ